MTTLENAARQALEALEEYQNEGAPFMSCDAAVKALREALEQPANWQEIDCPCCGDLARAFPPAPKREWVELTEVERQQALYAHPTELGVAYAIEAKIKEKNT